jgi:hypothetical protein
MQSLTLHSEGLGGMDLLRKNSEFANYVLVDLRIPAVALRPATDPE